MQDVLVVNSHCPPWTPSSGPGSHQQTGRCLWWRRHWLSGWRTRTSWCGCSFWCSGTFWAGGSESKKITYFYDLIILLKHHSQRVISLLQIVEKKIHQNQKKDILMKNLNFVVLFTWHYTSMRMKHGFKGGCKWGKKSAKTDTRKTKETRWLHCHRGKNHLAESSATKLATKTWKDINTLCLVASFGTFRGSFTTNQ